MFSIIGIVVVIGAVIGGYLMEHGKLAVLIQPAELVIIGGAAIGTLLIGNPLPVIIKIIKGILGILGSGKYNKNLYLNTLKMLNDLFSQGRKGGMVSLEPHVEEPDKSELFKKHEFLHKDHHALVFICDTLRMALSGTVSHFDLDQMIDVDLEVHHKEVGKPVSALTTVADSLPGLGIVAAVLGVVITMGSLGGPPEEIGHKVAAALVGTFLGILLCYGLVGPLAGNMAKLAEDEHAFYHVLRVLMASFMKGAPPIMAVEMARRAIPGHVRPSFKEVEKNCRTGDAAPAAAAAKAGA